MIGIDLDNTLIDYSMAFPKAAREMDLGRFGEIPATKHEIRTWLQGMDRNDVWTELQGHVYGIGIEHATLFPGAVDAMKAFRAAGRSMCIISHKTTFPAIGPKCDLRDAAMKWLEANGIFDPSTGIGLTAADVYFHNNRAEKAACIASMNCKQFIDDLPEMFAEPGYPTETSQCLFDPDNSHASWQGLKRCHTWSEIQQWLLSR